MIYTLGYTGRTMDEIKAIVEEHKAVLIDVRLVPFSRAPVWRKGSFQAALGEKYLHMKGFGNDNYKSGMLPVKLHNPELHEPSIRQMLLGSARLSNSIILMCACTDWTHCHRVHAAHWICERLGKEPEYWISHIPAVEKKVQRKREKEDFHKGVLPSPQIKLDF